MDLASQTPNLCFITFPVFVSLQPLWNQKTETKFTGKAEMVPLMERVILSEEVNSSGLCFVVNLMSARRDASSSSCLGSTI